MDRDMQDFLKQQRDMCLEEMRSSGGPPLVFSAVLKLISRELGTLEDEETTEDAEEREEDEDGYECPVCLGKKPATVALLPCGHVTCFDCGRRLHSCCVCREKILDRRRVFLASVDPGCPVCKCSGGQTVALFPCGHVSCRKCSRRLPKCGCCRGNVKSSCRLYI